MVTGECRCLEKPGPSPGIYCFECQICGKYHCGEGDAGRRKAKSDCEAHVLTHPECAPPPPPPKHPEIRITSVDAPIEAEGGESVATVAYLTNGMNVGGYAWAHLVDLDTEDVVGLRRESYVARMGSVYFSWSGLIMPNRNWRLRLECGHVE